MNSILLFTFKTEIYSWRTWVTINRKNRLKHHEFSVSFVSTSPLAFLSLLIYLFYFSLGRKLFVCPLLHYSFTTYPPFPKATFNVKMCINYNALFMNALCINKSYQEMELLSVCEIGSWSRNCLCYNTEPILDYFFPWILWHLQLMTTIKRMKS